MEVEGLLKLLKEHKVRFVIQYVVETDIHPFVKGTTFGRVWANRVKARFGQTFAWFASLDDLIEMKKAAGRPKDKEDLKFLRRLRQRKAKGRT